MQIKLPTLLNVFETDYEHVYSESYTVTIHQEATVEGYQYCTSLDRAFQSLISENFNNFVLKIGCTAVAIYCKGNVGLNIFDSHARDIYGRSHPQGTCVLLEVSSLNSLVHYFQSIHNDDIFELKEVNINKVQNSTLFQSHACETRKFNMSCAMTVYSLCYSVIKSCSYWNSNTLSDVIQYGKRLYENSSLNKYLPLDDLPKTVDVCGTEVSLDLKSDYSERILSDSVDSKSLFENLVRNNSECTGFLMWFSVFCMTCIFKPTKRSKYVYSLLLFNESQLVLAYIVIQVHSNKLPPLSIQ